MHMTDERFREALSNGPSHNAQALDMPNHIGEYREQ